MFTIPEVIRLLTRIFAKQNKRFPKGLEGVDIRIKAKKIHDVGKANNYQGGISEDQLKQFLAWEKQAPITTEVSKDILKVPKKKGEVIKVDFDPGGKQTFITQAEKKAELDKVLGPPDEVFGSPVKDWHMKEFKKPGAKDVTTEAQIKARIEKQNKESIQRLKDKMKDKDPEDFAGGGRTGSGLNYLLGEDDQNMRVPYGKGKLVDAGRRLFLQAVGAGAAGIGAAKSGLFSLLKGSKPVVKELTQVPIKDISGMPAWFKPLVNQVIKKGDDVTKTHAYQDMQVVHKTNLPDSKTEVLVTQNIDTGDVLVDIGAGKHGFSSGHLGQPVRLQYKASEIIEPTHIENIKKGERFKETGKPTKTKEEFWVEEAEFTGGHPENVKFEESTFEKFGEHGSNFDEVEKFATGKVKKKTAKESLKAERSHWVPEGDDMASGGRVPLAGGKEVLKGLAWLANKISPGSTKIGQTSKTMAPKTELKQAIAAFQEREAAAKLKIWNDPDKVRAAVDDIFPSGDYKYDAEMASEALVENNPKIFGGKLLDDIDDATRSEIYGAVLRVVQSDLAKMLQMKRALRQASKPTKTLEGIEKTGTINISDPNVAEEFSRFMKETDPKGHKKIEEIVEITNFDPKGKKGHASGGLAGMLGE